MKAVVDTNVPLVANQGLTEPSACAAICAERLYDFMQGRAILVLDDGGRIIKEYCQKLAHWPPNPGNLFLTWVLSTQGGGPNVELVTITPTYTGNQPEDYAQFPKVPASLSGFDHSDRKFVAVVRAHGDAPPVLVADDTDWWVYEKPLKAANVDVEFLCPALLQQRIDNPERKKKRTQKSE